MSRRPVVRLGIASALGVAAGFAAWSKAAPLEPFLDIAMRPLGGDAWEVVVTARGDTVEEVNVHPGAPSVRVVGISVARGLESARSRAFRVEIVPSESPLRPSIFVNQEGRTSRTHHLLVQSLP